MPSDYIIVESSGTPLLEQVMVFVIKTIGKSTSEITAILSSLPSAAMAGSIAVAEDASAAWMKGLDGTWGKIGSDAGGLPAGGTVGQYIKKLSTAYGDAAWENPDSVPTNSSTNLITSGGVDAALSVLGKAMCVLVEGNKSETVAAAGEYVIVRNSSITGRPDGLYTAAKAIPANTAIDSTYLTAVSGGGLNKMAADLNALNTDIATCLKRIGTMGGVNAGTYTYELPGNGFYCALIRKTNALSESTQGLYLITANSSMERILVTTVLALGGSMSLTGEYVDGVPTLTLNTSTQTYIYCTIVSIGT